MYKAELANAHQTLQTLTDCQRVVQVLREELDQAEEALRVSEIRFRTLFEQSPVSMQIFAPEGLTVQTNKAHHELFGLTLPQLASYNILEDQQLVEKGIMPYIRKGFAGEATAIPLIHYDAGRLFPEGRECWAQAFIYPVKDEAGNIREVGLIHQDVTALKQAEQLARGQTEVLTRTLDTLAGEPELDKFLGQVMTTINEQLHAPGSTLWFYDPATQTYSLHMTCYDGCIETENVLLVGAQNIPVTTSYEGQLHLEEMTRTRRPVVLNDIAHNQSIVIEAHRHHLLAQGVKAVLIAPLLLGEKIIGGLAIYNNERDYWRSEEMELAQALTQQASLAVQLTRLAERSRQSAVLEERNRMAREIHDTLAQAFTGILIQLGVAKRIEKQQPQEAWSLIERVSQLAQDGLAEARRSVWALYPEALEYSDLTNALARCVEQMTCGTPVRAQVCIQGTPRSLSPDVGMNLLRIGQEALTNALRHAHAQDIRIELTFEAQQVQLRVQDDGQGFEPQNQAESGGFGLYSMRQRAERIGGQLTIVSQPGRGTDVVVQTPIAQTLFSRG